MQINRYIWSETAEELKRRVFDRVQADNPQVDDAVRDIIATVRRDGDKALVGYTKEFDGVELSPDSLLVAPAEIDAAEAQLKPELRQALQLAHGNIDAYHREQVQVESWMKEISPGVLAGERVTPVASAALYVPRGKGSFPSVMLMLAVPAVIAGVPRIAVCTPPGPDGRVDAATLFVAKMCGIETIYKVGGAQIIAALTFGTESVERVQKVVGPGNQYVSAAKRLLYGHIDPGLPAGPSESIILADSTADAEIVAREWLVEAEHGRDSAALLVTDSREVADRAEELAGTLVAGLTEQRIDFVTAVMSGYGGIVLTDDLAASIDFVNEYAPEHLRVITANPLEVLPRILNAGEVLLGDYASIPYGNFAIGLNAILPTGGAARSHSGVGVHTFTKQSSFAYVSGEGARRIGPVAVELARWEGFPAHEQAARYALERAEGQ